ncbi:MAG: Kazal-type serine protease inhibitor domain-containing protein [Minicystis sp.]
MTRPRLIHAFVAGGLLLASSCTAPAPDGGEAVAGTHADLRGAGLPCGGLAGLSCTDGLACTYPIGSCGADDRTGTCNPKPEVCPFIWQPVCGCDGHQYPNGCEAARAGISVARRGFCDRKPDPLTGEPTEIAPSL